MLKPHSAMAPVIPQQSTVAPLGTEFLARIAAKHFARDLCMPGIILSRREACRDHDGCFAYRIDSCDGSSWVNIDLPGLTLRELTTVPPHWWIEQPKMYVDGIARTWAWAVEWAVYSLYDQLGWGIEERWQNVLKRFQFANWPM